jgi:hypothetical protein
LKIFAYRLVFAFGQTGTSGVAAHALTFLI